MDDPFVKWDEFLNAPTQEVARLVQQAGPQVCVFPINGTRRWAWLEHGGKISASPNPMVVYMDLAGQEYIRLFSLLFEHGIRTILSPVFGSELLTRGEEYVRVVLGTGVRQFVESPVLTHFYRSWGVRVRFYGDYLERLGGTPYQDIITLANQLAENTAGNSSYRLFLGMFADTPPGQILENLKKKGSAGKTPVETYYGDSIDPVTLFIGFDKPAVYDYPLLASGQEDLYFTVAPSPYLDAQGLRAILYDHLYLRRAPEPEWEALTAGQADALREYYRDQRGTILGTGRLFSDTWVPDHLEEMS